LGNKKKWVLSRWEKFVGVIARDIYARTGMYVNSYKKKKKETGFPGEFFFKRAISFFPIASHTRQKRTSSTISRFAQEISILLFCGDGGV
jgi:hypothetical protein